MVLAGRMKPSQKKIWFPAQRYGIGWRLPVCWQGWFVIIVFGICYFPAALFILRSKEAKPYFPVFAIGAMFTYLFIFWLKGEKLKWRWGEKEVAIQSPEPTCSARGSS
jgi:hypothetical protein